MAEKKRYGNDEINISYLHVTKPHIWVAIFFLLELFALLYSVGTYKPFSITKHKNLLAVPVLTYSSHRDIHISRHTTEMKKKTTHAGNKRKI